VHGQVTAYSALALSRFFIGELIQARLDTQSGIELAVHIHSWRMLGYLHGYRAMIEQALGNVDAALEHSQHAIELGQLYRHDEITAGGYRILGDIYLRLKDFEKSIVNYRQSLQITGEKFLMVDPMFRLGLSLCLAGEFEQGQQLLQQAVELARSAGLGVIQILAQLSQAMTYYELGEWGQAYQLATYVQEETLRRKMIPTHLRATNLLGQIALHEDDIPRALDYFEGAAHQSAGLPYPWIELDSQRMMIKALPQTGQSKRATGQRVHILLDQIGAQAQKEPVKQSFQRFRQQIISELP
jgi:tetratricopeptide (TPR) repeat protein